MGASKFSESARILKELNNELRKSAHMIKHECMRNTQYKNETVKQYYRN
jgi:hypothetical protein